MASDSFRHFTDLSALSSGDLRTILDARTTGTVLPLVDSERSQQLAGSLEIVTI